ncbi:MAG: ABC transporter permease, partial [Candidatus Bathyarchaeia archaeon]
LLKLTNSSIPASVGFIIVCGFILLSLVVAVGGYSVLPYNPITQNVGPPFSPPSWKHPFGTDQVGRDMFSRVLYAAPNALFVSVVIIGSATLIGTFLGSTSAYHGGVIDDLLMRVTDLFLALPGLILAIAISVALGAGLINMMYALMITWWPAYARMARGEALRVSQYNFIEAARAAGLSSGKIILKHIIPNIMTTMIVYATIDFGQVIMVYAGLSYLGLSVQPPMPDWGAMVNYYQGYLVSAPWLPFFPGLVIAMVVIGFGLLGDGIRDAIESQV